MKPNKFLSALVFNLVMALLISVLFSTSFFAMAIMVNAGGVIMHLYKVQTGRALLFDGLAREIWLPDVMEDFYPDSSFLSQARDLSSLVENDAINLAEAGVDPTVLVDNNIYPIPMAEAQDTPLRKVLQTYDTTSTVVRNAVALELAYDQRRLYTDKHKKALLAQFGIDAAYAYAPTANATLNPVLDATADNANEILDRIIELQTAYNTADAPMEGRVLVLDPIHASIIAKEDKKLYKSFEAEPGKMLFGFKTYMFSKNPIYVKATGAKAAKGAAFVGATHARSSFAFLDSECMKAQGTFKLFSTLNDPANKGDVFNFQMRGLVQALRNKYRGAILK